ncbi:MAG TPA: multicopper oxidase domain-containing protein [Thermoanaerobaculia bacterium]|nr:multicopper oxidase domain-containing protein [Thermoanaerobaculia bacterium]
MIQRRDCLKIGLVAGGGALLARRGVEAQDPKELLKFLCPPDGEAPDSQTPSPKARPFVAPLFVPPIKQPVAALVPPPDPRAHQRYEEFLPQKLYQIREEEFRWVYHPDPPYAAGSWSWGFDGSTPGPTYHARYGEPILVRRVNGLPPVGFGHVGFALPSTSTHLHNGHTASESDGSPQDWIDSGEFWDHHYGNFPSNHDPREKLATLWYHDHRLDFTAANVYAGLDGFYLLFDEQDSGNENDPNPEAWRLPSGKYDVPLILHDVLFDANGQVRWSPFNTAGILGDRYTVNRRIQPFFQVERRKYRFRILNGGPSRFYQLFLSSHKNFTVITGDGNFLPAPLEAESIYLSVAQRVDVIIDFAQYDVGAKVELLNKLRQNQGQGPTGGLWDRGDPLIQFQVIAATGSDPSRVPDKFRPLPPIDMSLVKQERTWVFDYVGGLWTVNGKVMDPNRIDAGIERGTSEIWTIRNGGNNWSHPIHSHFTEYMLLEVNGRPVTYDQIQSGPQESGEKSQLESYFSEAASEKKPVVRFMGGRRRDIATLLPGDEIKIYMHWTDFLGKYVMHCHNVVHEDHAMMVRWDIVEPGKGFTGPRSAAEVYGRPDEPPHMEARPASPTAQEDQGPPPTPPIQH